MILRQCLHTDPVVAASYLVGCGGKGIAAVVDPVAEPEFYLREAAGSGMFVRYVIDTHLHADHVSSGPALAANAGAEYVLSADADATIPFRPARHGDRV